MESRWIMQRLDPVQKGVLNAALADHKTPDAEKVRRLKEVGVDEEQAKGLIEERDFARWFGNMMSATGEAFGAM